MAYQVPHKDHPWRRYPNRQVEEPLVKRRSGKPLKLFIQEISESWDEVSVVTTAYGQDGNYKLGVLPQEKQASWLIGVLKRNYVSY